MENFNRCYGCMEPLKEGGICPKCHFDRNKYTANPRCFPPGTLLHEKRYVIGKVEGEGGFGITYIGWDRILDIPVAIKEYFPNNLGSRDCTTNSSQQIHVLEGKSREVYQKGLEKYMQEARILSKFRDMQGIVSVQDFFYDNGTAYIIMEYIRGITLKESMRSIDRMDAAEVFRIMEPIMQSLEIVHRSGIIHRDISPDNIMINRQGEVKLIDFGAARAVEDEDHKSLTVMLKRGFAPEEQYRSKGNQGPWTDVYAISATMYFMITGKVPPEAMERMVDDTLESFENLGISMPGDQACAIMKGLGVMRRDRYNSIGELYHALYHHEVKADTEDAPEQPPEDIPQERKQEIKKQADLYQKTVLLEDEDYPELTRKIWDLPRQEPIHIDLPADWGREEKRKKIAVLIFLLVLVIAGGTAWYESRKEDGKSPSEPASVVEVPQSNQGDEKKEDKKIENATPTPTPEYKMISVVGKKVKQAKKELAAWGDKKLDIIIATEYSQKVKAGYVIRQSVKKGSRYLYGELKEIKLTVSKGEKLYKVPSVIGQVKGSAVKKLKNIKMKIKTVSAYSSRYKKGRVIRQSVKAGKKVKKGSAITITLSRGKKPVSQKPKRTSPTPVRTPAPTRKPVSRPAATPAPTKKPQSAPIVSKPSGGKDKPPIS